MSLLKEPSGRWRRSEVETPAKERLPVYADIDKNRATIKGETMARRLAKLLASKGISGEFRARKHDFSVSKDWAPFARVVDVTPAHFGIQWNIAALRDLDLDKAALASDVMASVVPQSQVSWG